jgi:hypothetical protein
MMLHARRATPAPADPLFPRLPELDSRLVRLPSATDLAGWRKEANLRMEDALARFDAALIECQDIDHSARLAIEEVTGWVRSSIGSFSTGEGAVLVHGHVRQACASAWAARDAEMVLKASNDPDCVDRHLRLFIGLAYESAARGYAALISV